MNETIIITGGAGFIGSNAALHFADQGAQVHVFDNFSREGSSVIRDLLRDHSRIVCRDGDVRRREQVTGLIEDFEEPVVVLHLAAQVAVTRSVEDPRHDFNANALGTFNVLEAMRKHAHEESVLLFASTNKVYGNLDQVEVTEGPSRYEYENLDRGISEDHPLDFHSPYGCSKGSADQYVLDYAQVYDLNTAVFRQSCIYGPRQFGVEDQGWVAWFTIAAVFDLPLTIFGDGKQVRDVLYIDDLIGAFERAVRRIDRISGEAFNIGGGPDSTCSLLELITLLEELSGKEMDYSFDDWRPGDQRVFVSDITKAREQLDWQPGTTIREGVGKLYHWIQEHQGLIEQSGVLE